LQASKSLAEPYREKRYQRGGVGAQQRSPADCSTHVGFCMCWRLVSAPLPSPHHVGLLRKPLRATGPEKACVGGNKSFYYHFV